LAVAALFSTTVARAQSKDVRGNLALVAPAVESHDKGVLVDLVKAIAEEYKDGQITWDVYPFAKTLTNVEQGRADFQMPLLHNPNISDDKLPFLVSTESLYRAVFVLYTNQDNKDINLTNLSKYNIETDMGHVAFFDFKVTGSTSIESSLQKVSSGKIDGWIFSQSPSDQALKRLGLSNIKRWEYRKFDVTLVTPKTERGKEVNAALTKIISQLKASGKYNAILASRLNQDFKE
jgi:polar amino acid transport system substrate-binding protein